MKLLEYIEKYGDLSFNERPLNNVDKLLFANLSYVNYKDCVSNNDKNKKTLSEVSSLFFKKKYNIERNIIAIKGGINLLNQMSKKRRYKDLLLYNYVRTVNELEQFSALTIEINKKLVYVSIEGTADEMIGWEEDFMLSYKFPIKSQKSIIKYLNKKFTFKNVDIIIGGHSKGGNLALVGSMYSNILIRHKIKEIYSYDGPGLLSKQLHSYKYKLIEKKYTHIVPNNSMVGMMLYSKNHLVIKTYSVGMLSHFALNWQVGESDFIYDKLNNSSIELEKKLSKWIETYSNKEKKQFVKEMFDVFRKNNVKTLLDFMDRPSALIKILSDSNHVSKKTSIMFQEFSLYVRRFLFRTLKEKIIK